jgi:hypothetical protein
MLVAISGSQGSGKSTIVDLLAERGHKTIERKSARSVLEEWGVTLPEVNASAELTTKFQEEIINRKFIDEQFAIQDDDLWFTERTHADLFTYALVSLGKNNQYSEWLSSYYKACMEYNQHYAGVYYLRAGHFKIEHDGTRGSGEHYSRMVDLVMLDITKQMVHTSKLTVIETPDLEQRVNLISVQAEQLKQ